MTTPSSPQPISFSVSVDEAHCAASALCTRIAPEVFGLDRDGFTAVVLKTPLSEAEAIGLAAEAERSCPTLAISLAPTTGPLS